MADKRVYRSESVAQLSDNPWNDNGTPKALIRVKGLRPTGIEGTFEVDGLTPRPIQWQGIAAALGYDLEVPAELADKIGRAVFEYDIVEWFRDAASPA